MKTGLVLGGGSARGAYEAGVLSYLREELPAELGHPVRLDLLSGTSVGALNACYLAATAHQPEIQSKGMVGIWQSLRIEQIIQFGVGDIFRIMREFAGTAPMRWEGGLSGGLVNPSGLIRAVVDKIPWKGVAPNIRKGNVEALAVSATHLGSGEVRLFVQRRDGTAPRWSLGRYTQAQPARIGPKHALASAALPVIFPAVRVGGQMYCDGGLRHSLPLSPALRLGAERVIVVPLRHKAVPGGRARAAQKPGIASAPFLVGKTLNALLLDHTDQDLDRLDRINDIIQAGTEAYGATFVETLNRAMVPHRNSPVRHVRRIVVRPSQDLGALAGEYVRSAEFKARVKGQLVGRVIRRLAERESQPDTDEADLVSYLLFDGGFADQLIQLGRSDARALKQEWIRFFQE